MNLKHFSVLLLLSLGSFFIQQGCGKSEETKKDGAYLPSEQEIIDESTDSETVQVRTTEWQSPEEQLVGFQLPPGFQITLFASEPDIGKPINMEFDAKGRLWVTQSSEYPFAAEPGEGSDRITILEDTNGDGQADKFTHFVDTLNIPIGIMPVQNGAITFSIPNIYRFSDQDGDGYADDRKVLFGEFGYQDTHGMVNNFIRGFDGWIYANHGFTNTSTFDSPEGDSITMVSGNTFRFLPDGSRVEQTTAGRVNPFGFAYDEWGYLYSVDCHSVPIYQLINGAEYPSFGIRERPNIGFGPRMMDYNLGPTAVSGLVYYIGEQFPEEYRNSFYSGNVASSRVNRNTMEFVGSTPVATREEDFLISADPWFRPVDFKTGPDGALYIADFYNRIIGHYEVALDHPGRDRQSGRIWRITYPGNDEGRATPTKDWSKVAIDELVAALNNSVLSTRIKIADQLVNRYGEQAIDPVYEMMQLQEQNTASFIQGLWILHRLEALPIDLLEDALYHRDPMIRVHALRVLAEMETLSAHQRILTLHALQDGNPHVQRAAAEVLAQFPHIDHVEPLTAMYIGTTTEDTHLRYTGLLSIRYQLRDPDVMEEVPARQWSEEQLTVIMDVVSDVPTAEAASFALTYLKGQDLSLEKFERYMPFFGRYLTVDGLEHAISLVQERFSHDLGGQYSLHQGLVEGLNQQGAIAPASMHEWASRLAGQLLEEETGQVDSEEIAARQIQAAALAVEYQLNDLTSAFRAVLTETQADQEARTAAAGALMHLSPQDHGPVIVKVLNDSNETLELREQVALTLGESIGAMTFDLLEAGLSNTPRRLQIAISSVLAGSAEGIDYLLQAIQVGYVDADVLSEPMVYQHLMANLKDAQKQKLEELPEWQESQQERDELIRDRLENFDSEAVSVEEGRTVFVQHCNICHQVQDSGGLIGPQLDGIGSWGAEALTEKILNPNQNVSEAFRTHHITRTDGRTQVGLLKREVGEVLVFANMGGREFSIAKSDILERTVSDYSLMPDHFGEILDQEDFDALLKYLLSLE